MALEEILAIHEQWLVERVLRYAEHRGYTVYTFSPWEERRLSMSRLTSFLAAAERKFDDTLSRKADGDNRHVSPVELGVLEAKAQRERGMSFEGFLGLIQCYRKSYRDLFDEKAEDTAETRRARLFVEQHLDRIEIDCILGWNFLSESDPIPSYRNRELEDFTYALSHDVRAPLRAIIGFSQMLEEDFSNVLGGDGRDKLKVIRESAKEMNRLIDGLLEFSRAGRRELHLESVDMNLVVKDLVARIKNSVAPRNLVFEVGELPPAFCDRVFVREAFLKLVDNAVKFTFARDVARIEIHGRVEPNRVLYSIKDNGIGFNMKYHDKAFQIFQRLHHAHELEGTGVGLAVVHRIAIRHGGTVWAEAQEDVGAEFFFSLPEGGEHGRKRL